MLSLRFDHELVSRVGMQAGSGKATGPHPRHWQALARLAGVWADS
jgi:hypothetical protein